jgi:hypothetical protein
MSKCCRFQESAGSHRAHPRQEGRANQGTREATTGSSGGAVGGSVRNRPQPRFFDALWMHLESRHHTATAAALRRTTACRWRSLTNGQTLRVTVMRHGNAQLFLQLLAATRWTLGCLVAPQKQLKITCTIAAVVLINRHLRFSSHLTEEVIMHCLQYTSDAPWPKPQAAGVRTFMCKPHFPHNN